MSRMLRRSETAATCLLFVAVLALPGRAAAQGQANSAQAQATSAQAQASSVPLAADGKPDLSGIWQVMNTAAWDIQDHAATLGVPGGQGVVEGNEIPYQPSALAKKQENFRNRSTADPETKCYLPGVPRVMYMPYPFRIVQQADRVTILHEYLHAIRYVYMNGNPHPRGHIDWY